MYFYCFDLNYFRQFFGFFYFYLLKKTDDASIDNEIGCLRIVLSYSNIGLVPLPD